MIKSKAFSRFMAMVMAAVLMLGMVPANALAEDEIYDEIYIDDGADELTLSEPIIITGFETLSPEIAFQSFFSGEYEEESLILPEILEATDESGNFPELPITWVCNDFAPDSPADYEFIAILPEGYAYAEGLNAPVINIAILSDIVQPILLRAAGLVTISQTDSVSQIQTNIQAAIDAADEGETLTVTGSKTDADAKLELVVGPDITLVWQAAYSGSLDGSDYILGVSGGGILEIVSGGSIVNNGEGIAISSSFLDPCRVIVNGGTVSTVGNRSTIRSSVTEIKSGMINATEGWAINSVDFIMSGGFVFAYGIGNGLIGVIDATLSINPALGDDGVIVSWNNNATSGPLVEGTSAWLTKVPESASAVWANESGESGIRYTNGENTGFLPVSGITVEPASSVPTLTKRIVSRDMDSAYIKFISNKAGIYYYRLNGAPPTSAALIAAGTNAASMTEGEDQIINLAALPSGPHTLYIAAEDMAGGESALMVIDIPSYEDSGDTNINIGDLTGDIPVGTYANWSYVHATRAITSYGDISVRGSKTDVSERLYLIDSGKVTWQAEYIGSTTAGVPMVYILGSGTLDIASGGSVINTGDGIAAMSYYAFITVSGGEVKAAAGSAIYADGGSMGFPVTISDGTVASGAGTAIYVKRHSSSNDTVTITGGFVLSYGTDIEGAGNVIDADDVFINPEVGDNGVVIAWDNFAYTGPFSAGDTDGLIIEPSSAAMWGKAAADCGISYANGENIGFFQVEGVTVTSDGASVYLAALAVNKDDEAYIGHGKTYTLKLSGNESVTHTMAGANGIVTAVVADGIWKVYDGGVYTGTDIVINGEAGGGVLNYYTVSYSVNNQGIASGSTIYADYGGSAVSSGEVVQGGKSLTITVTGAGAANYTYAWSGQGTSGQTADSVTIASLSAAVNAVCGVTGFAQTYSVTVSSAGTGSAGGGSYEQGVTVGISAGTPPANMRFKNWTAEPTVIFADSTGSATTFTMPASAVTVSANFEAIPPSVTDVSVNPAAVTVQKGMSYQFGAVVSGTNNPGQGVVWSISGNNDAGTTISGGLLNVAAGETATTLLMTATSAVDGTKSGTAAVTISGVAQPVPTVSSVTIIPASITLNKGDSYIFSAVVQGSNNPGQGVIWEVTSGVAGTSMAVDGKLTVAQGETAAALTVRATSALDTGKSGTASVSIVQPVQPTTFTVSFNANGGSVSPLSMQTGAGGKLVTLPVPIRSGYSFNGWFTAASAGAQVSVNTVFTANATVYARWIYTGGSETYSEYTSDDSSDNNLYYQPVTGIITEKQPDMPALARLSVKGIIKDKTSTSTITKKAAENAIAALEITDSGIAVQFDINGGGYTSLSITFERAALEALRAAGVKYVKIGSPVIDIAFDAKSLEVILAQTAGSITVSAMMQGNDKMSEPAQKAIGSRPMFDINIKDASDKIVSDLKGGTASVAIAYKPSSAEKTENLQAVYVKRNGQIQWLGDSNYHNGKLVFTRNSFSVYGVGYKMPAPVFSDTAEHWAKEHIYFITGMGLISGTTATEFSPDEAITRKTFILALGKLSGADVSGYRESGFIDIDNGDFAMPYIEWAVENNIVQGVGNSHFDPDRPITREQMAVMMNNYAEAMNYAVATTYRVAAFVDDAYISNWAEYAVRAVQGAGIISGKSGNFFDPQGSATRAEASTVLRKFIELVVEEGMARAWVQNDTGRWQYVETDGKTGTGWLAAPQGNKYWFDDEGIMVSGKWVHINGKWYYFYENGQLALNTLVDGYEVDADGVRKED